MSFRLEEKVILHPSDYLKLIGIIKDQNKNNYLYPSRKISSLYFDNENNDMFVDGEEGTLPRKKIRLRFYPDQDKDKFFIEKKINSYEGKFKKSRPINKNDFVKFYKKGIFDKTYNICKPKFWVTYRREYFSFLNVRFTIDRNIKFSRLNKKNEFKVQNKLILEIKSKNINLDIFNGEFPFMRSRYSKYAEGHKVIFKWRTLL